MTIVLCALFSICLATMLNIYNQTVATNIAREM